MDASIYIEDGVLFIDAINLKYSKYFTNVDYMVSSNIITAHGYNIDYQFFSPALTYTSAWDGSEYFCENKNMFDKVSPEYLQKAKKLIKPKWWEFSKKEEEVLYTTIKMGWVKMLTEPKFMTFTSNRFIIKE